MTINAYLASLRRRAWILAVTTILGALVGYGFAASKPTTYQAASELYITLAPGTPAMDVNASATLVQEQMVAYAALAKSPMVLDPVVTSLKLSTTATDLSSRVSAESPAGTTLLDVKVSDQDPQRASEIANGIAKELVSRISDFAPTASNGKSKTLRAFISYPAVTPDTPTGTSTGTLTAMGAAAGLLLGALLAVLAELADPRLRSEEDLDRLGVPILGALPRPGGKRHDQLDVFRRIRTNLDARASSGNPVYVVSSTNLHEPRSRVVHDLAEVAGLAGRKVLVIDAEGSPSKTVASTSGAPQASSKGFAGVLRGEIGLPDAAHSSDLRNVDVLEAGLHGPALTDLFAGNQLEAALTEARANYDLVLVDSPPILSQPDAAVLGRNSDGALLVLTARSNRTTEVRHALDVLRAGSVPVLGAVLSHGTDAPRRPTRRRQQN